MFAVSEVLQRARLDQGIDLATAAAGTKIKCEVPAGHRGRRSRSLPGGFFYKSFAHQYATFLGVDTQRDRRRDRSRVERGCSSAIVHSSQAKGCEAVVQARAAGKYFSYAAFVLLLVVCTGIDGWWHESGAPVAQNTTRRRGRGPDTGRVSLASVSQVTAGPAAAAPVATVARQDEPAAPAGSRVELALTATEDTWLSVSSDGAPVFSRPSRGQSNQDHRRQRIRQVTGWQRGRPGSAIEWQPLGPLGAHGQVRDLVVTPDKFQFVSPPNEIE